jgi:hypothetical protein
MSFVVLESSKRPASKSMYQPTLSRHDLELAHLNAAHATESLAPPSRWPPDHLRFALAEDFISWPPSKLSSNSRC